MTVFQNKRSSTASKFYPAIKNEFPVGTNDGETIDIDLKKVDREALGLKGMDFSTLSAVYRQEGATKTADEFDDGASTPNKAASFEFSGVTGLQHRQS